MTRAAPRTGARRAVLRYIAQLPQYVRLLWGLLGDRRVSRLDKAFVLGALVYIVSPIDLIPDFIPFLGQVDDVFFLLLALERLLDRAGPEVLLDHWHGDPEDLDGLNVEAAIAAAVFFLPKGWRGGFRKLRRA